MITMLGLETRSYTFKAFGATEGDALRELWAAWERHVKQCNISLADSCFPTIDHMKREGISIIKIHKLPLCLRDGETI
jgi:nucleotidyltransferase/DNA polymerase involved in DNA repair